jgi:putative nucleotidyltransferase with HDIG domain
MTAILDLTATKTGESTTDRDIPTRAAINWQPRPFPFAILKFTAACEKPNCNAAELGAIISTDPVIAGRILRLANSSAFGCSGRVRTLEHAIVLLGLKTLKNFALTLGASMLYADGPESAAEARDKNWQHSLQVACISRELARRNAKVQPDEAFLLGLLHDIGKLVFLDRSPFQYPKLLESNLGEKLPLLEQHVFGLDHAEMTARCLNYWKLPAHWETIVSHHHAEPTTLDMPPLVKELTLNLILANKMTRLDFAPQSFDWSPWSLHQSFIDESDWQNFQTVIQTEINELMTACRE